LPLQPIEAVQTLNLRPDRQIWRTRNNPGDRPALIQAINLSLQYLDTPAATKAYENYTIRDFTLDRVRRSLVRFRQLVRTSRSPAALQTAVEREFNFYRSIGSDGQGTVEFTAYFQPTYQASRGQTDEFRYPLYRIPPDLDRWTKPHPTRAALEGSDGLRGSDGRLRGLELVWLRDRLEAYLIQVQGSAVLQLTDGSQMAVGYAGRTDYPYVSIGRELVNAGIFPAEELTLLRVIQYFREHPEEMDVYLPRNNRFVFFEKSPNAEAIGSLGVPVTAGRSIATDKSILPPGALALIQTRLPERDRTGEWVSRPVSRYVLDQDTGGAIRGPGRVDVFMGTGDEAGERAGLVNTPGRLYYLLLKE
jgi:membrane-bound lytic murein transglycosylase A